MDEIEEFKKFLGPIAKDYTDAQLRQLRREMHAMAELLLDIHLANTRAKPPKTTPDLTGLKFPPKIPPS